MHPYLGAYTAGSTVYGMFNTKNITTQAPITLAGSPSLTCYKNADGTQDTSGLTLDEDFDSVTGLHQWSCDTSTDPTFYAAPAEIFVTLAAGTVSGVSVVGQVVAQFSLVADGLTAAQETDVETAAAAALAAYSAATSAGVAAVPSLVMSVAASSNGIDANVQRINDTAVLGNGTSGNKWRG